MSHPRLASSTTALLAPALRATHSLRTVVLSVLLVGTSASARAAEPAQTPTAPAEASNEAEPASASPDPADPTPTGADASTEAPPVEPAEDPAAVESSDAGEAPGAPQPKHYDYDTPDLERRDRYPAAPAPAPAHDSAENVLRTRVGALLFGVGLTSAVVAPIFVLRPRTPIEVEQGEGTAIALGSRPAPLIAGGVISVVGGISGAIGGRILSDLGGDPRRARARQRGLAIASGLAIGAATGLLTAGVVDLSRGGVLWNDVLSRPLDADDAADGDEAARRLSRGIALLTMVPPIAGLGLGLSLGPDARARVVPSPTGVAVAGRF